MRRITINKGSIYVEILVVIVIFVLLTQIEAPNVAGGGEYYLRAVAAKEIWDIEHILNLYCKQNGLYPTTKQGLEALVSKPVTNPIPENYPERGYLKMVPFDPWCPATQ